MSKLRYLAFFIVAAFLLTPSAARAQATPNKIKLLTQNTGWALLYGRLYWTNDFGQDWRDITPKAAASGRESITDVFFLNTSDGWALLRNAVNDGGRYGGWSFDLAATEDGGITWSVTPVDLPGWDAAKGYGMLGGSGTLDFIDVSHGWVDLSVQSSTAFNGGAIFATTDGGATYRPVHAPVGFGWVKFISLETGWAGGGPGMSQLTVTRDGGKTWSRVQLPPPKSVPPTSFGPRFFSPPDFAGARTGFLPTLLNNWTLATYATSDAGETWHPAAVLTEPPGRLTGDSYPLAIADSALLLPMRSRTGRPALRALRMAGSGTVAVGELPPQSGILAASFVDSSRGWVVGNPTVPHTGVRVLGTTDGGATWSNATPKPPAPPARRSFAHPEPHFWKGSATTAQPSTTSAAFAAAPGGGGGGSSLHTSAHLGFGRSRLLASPPGPMWLFPRTHYQRRSG